MGGWPRTALLGHDATRTGQWDREHPGRPRATVGLSQAPARGFQPSRGDEGPVRAGPASGSPGSPRRGLVGSLRPGTVRHALQSLAVRLEHRQLRQAVSEHGHNLPEQLAGGTGEAIAAPGIVTVLEDQAGTPEHGEGLVDACAASLAAPRSGGTRRGPPSRQSGR